MENIDKIIEKVQKLLALAGNNPNENEASLAAEKAQALLEAYNLDMTVVGASKSTERQDKRLSGGLYKWQREIWRHVAALNYCYYWSIKGLVKGAKYEHRVVGSKVNVLATKMMAEYLQDAIERITRERYENDPKLYFAKPAIAFREGMAERIGERLNRRRWDKENEAREEKRKQEERARQTGESVSLTILDVKQAEREANDDFLYGEGYTAKWKAQTAQWEAEAAERRKKAEEEAERFMREHPEEYARMQAEKAKQEERERKREERNRRRRKGRSYSSPSVRHEDHYAGYSKGNDVGLDPQVGRSGDTKRIG